jgi:BirA family transcriptional regulator, biotin operon repressor / biotin---[acetyl-CoA-carboxylase] ligase
LIIVPPHQIRELRTSHLGRRLLIFPRLDSTNALALNLAADPSQGGLVLLAHKQTAGRGQHGRTWHAPPGSSVLMSVLLFPPPPLRRAAPLVAWAAVSVCELVRDVAGLDATIKWPNDMLVGDKKICGILIEHRNTADADRPLATVAGIGLNVTQPAETFAAAGLPLAGSLFSMSGRLLETDAVAEQLIVRLDAEFDRLTRGDFAALEARWRERLGIVGRHVSVDAVNQTRRGRLLDVTFAHVSIEDDAGTIVRFAPEEVRHLEPT